ncbi:MAG TPA: chemotaxis protein CheB [Desulfobacteraceae bacterium]|nr:chemotaxis protein CheB [Desulfobacteraceae bacterium]|tara:strand:+ start:596 stop:1186 length:591 start_codon:yes stop_codon:yes gene_type:complete
MNTVKTYQALVIGVSAGGLAALKAVLPGLSARMDQPVIVVQHMSPDSDDFLVQYFDKLCSQSVKEAEDKLPICKGTIYFAPPNYHLLVEDDKSFALSTAERVQYSRPAIDVLFETAADVYKQGLVGVILTGANADGTKGVTAIRAKGGFTIAQSPKTAEAKTMPGSAIEAGVDMVLDLEEIAPFINRLMSKGAALD